MIKLIAMLLAYKFGRRAMRDHAKNPNNWPSNQSPTDTFSYFYRWMYDTLMGPVKRDSVALAEIAAQIQSWLDFQEHEYQQEGTPLTDGSHLIALPYWPSRGTLKAWVKALRKEKGE